MDSKFLEHLSDLTSAGAARQQAESIKEQQLAQNLAGYLKSLADALVTESVPDASRHMAGLIIKNAINGNTENVRQKQVAWSNIPQNQRDAIKSTLLKGLASTCNPARRGCAAAISSIATTEFLIEEWKDLIPILVNAIKQNNPVVQEATLTTIGFICEDIDPIPAFLEQQAIDILNAIAFGSSSDKPIEVRRAAIRAMCGALPIVRNIFCGEKASRDHIMTIVCNACKDNDSNIQTDALLALVKIAEEYYDELNQDYMGAIWGITSALMTTDLEYAPLTIEFWSTIAEMEREKHIEQEEDPVNAEPCPEFSEKILGLIIPKLCENLLKQSDETDDDEEWNIATASAACITILAECTREKIITIIAPFVQQIKSDNWRQREASTMAFGSILSTYASEEKDRMILMIINVLMDHLASDPHECVRSTSAWALSRIALASPEIITQNTLAVVRSLVGGLANSDPVIAYYSCFGILNILNIYAGRYAEEHNDLSDIFVPLFRELINAGEREDSTSTKLRITSYEAINTLIEVAPMDCIPKTKEMIHPFLAKLEKSFSLNMDLEDQRQLQAYIPLVLQTITKRIGDEIEPYAPDMYKKFIQIFETRKCIVDESMNAIATLFEECPNMVQHCINTFSPYFLTALQNFQDTSVLKSGLICLGSICDSLGPNLYFVGEQGSFCQKILEHLITHLRNPDVEEELRPLIIISFADIALAIGGHFNVYFVHIMNALCAASDTAITADSSDDFIDYVIKLREAILEACPPVMDSMVEAGKQQEFVPFLGKLIPFMERLWYERDYRTRTIVASMLGLIGDILKNIVPIMSADDRRAMLQRQFILEIIELCINHENPDTKATAEWAKKQLEAARM
mmetsp:Transcript_30862/g.52813  ORF Transcript_30862/g.52813 Transcript_30862/m.52813 type:complete len:861 (+) Transcript_30862:33-2615(+)